MNYSEETKPRRFYRVGYPVPIDDRLVLDACIEVISSPETDNAGYIDAVNTLLSIARRLRKDHLGEMQRIYQVFCDSLINDKSGLVKLLSERVQSNGERPKGAETLEEAD